MATVNEEHVHSIKQEEEAQVPGVKVKEETDVPATVVKAPPATAKAENAPETPAFDKAKTPVSKARRVQPLASLNPYNNVWTICVQASGKSALRTYNSAKGPGSVFDVTLTDEAGTEIRATLWREVADRYYSIIEDGKAYYVSNAMLKPANRTYNSTNNDYEMTINERSKVEEAGEEVSPSTFKVSYDFIKIPDLSVFVGRKRLVDVVGIATQVGPIGSIKRKSDDSELLRREVTLLDQGAQTVTVTLWGKLAEEQGAILESSSSSSSSSSSPPVIVIKGCRVTDYNGVSLSTVVRSEVLVGPAAETLPAAAALVQWYNQGGSSVETKAAGEGLATARKVKRRKRRKRRRSTGVDFLLLLFPFPSSFF